ncbi:MAG: 16S rRNA (cytidine(1402)-2'-O)-methyltransferase [Candidatus Pacebacteria bacterium]|nr:16S rRNA (cytidine(1402)-2'-O)-methyltransferase [Candidatus Paceibacterota bacterium]
MALYIVATPIGNLKDISLRALEVLKEVDLILCEDTRTTGKLLDRYQIKTSVLSYHQHSKFQKIDYIMDLLKQGKNLALVSDAGTPGISDPGNKLIESAIQQDDKITITSIPGPSAAAAVASISGFPMDKFLFLGFPPVKNKRKKFFEEIIDSKYPVIFYESPYRIIKTLSELSNCLNRKIVVCRELTKKFETVYRGKVSEVMQRIEKDVVKGEFVVVIEGKK